MPKSSLFCFVCLLFPGSLVNAQVQRSYEVSIDRYNAAVELQKKAKFEIESGSIKKSYTYILKSIQNDSSSHRSYELLYQASLMDNNYSDSIIDYFKDSKKIFGNDDEICFYIAEIYRLRKDFQKAVSEYTKAIELAKNSEIKPGQYFQFFAGRALCFVNLKRYNEAILDYTCYLNQYPNDNIILVNRGVCYQKNGNLNSAILDWKKSALSGNQTAMGYLKSITRKKK